MKAIWTVRISNIIAINAGFFESPESIFSLSERQLKQLKTDVNINRAKNAVSSMRLSLEYLK